MTPKQILLKFIKIALVFFFLIIFLGVFASVIFLNSISKSIGKTPTYLIETIYNSVKNNQYKSMSQVNFLILGLDPRNDTLEKTETTDTIIFASLNLKTFKLSLISTPRDLWFYPKETKINNLYPMALSQKEQDKFDFLKTNFQELYGQPIDHIIVLTTNNLIDFVNIIGGVDVYLPKSYTDKQYPNPDYIKNPSPAIPMYKTVTFPAGNLHLDQSNITEFVRSRKGSETAADGGTDIGRIERQQLLISAIFDKIKSGNLVNNETQIKNLYLLWDQQITKSFSDTDILKILIALDDDISKLTTNKVEIPVGDKINESIVYHPSKFINKQWVYIPNDTQYKSFQEFISQSVK